MTGSGGAPLGKPRLHLGIGKGRVDLRVELVANASMLGVLWLEKLTREHCQHRELSRPVGPRPAPYRI